MAVINRTQALVLGFFALAWVALITILVVAPQVYDRALRQAPSSLPTAEIVFAAGLSGLIAVLCVAGHVGDSGHLANVLARSFTHSGGEAERAASERRMPAVLVFCGLPEPLWVS